MQESVQVDFFKFLVQNSWARKWRVETALEIRRSAELWSQTQLAKGGFKEGAVGRGPHLKVWSLVAVQMQCQIVALCNVTSLCLAFSGGDIEFDFVLMTSAYIQYLQNTCKQHLAS